MGIPVSVLFDICGGACSHFCIDGLKPPPAPCTIPCVPPYQPSYECPVPMVWPPGLLSTHKFSSSVIHSFQFIALEGHDCGRLAASMVLSPDIATNCFYPVAWALSQRKMAFSASTVQMNGKPTATACLVSLPAVPMMTCGQPMALPGVFPITNALSSVVVGMTVGDFVAGYLGIAASMALDLALNFACGATGQGKIVEEFLSSTIGYGLGQAMDAGIGHLGTINDLAGNPLGIKGSFAEWVDRTVGSPDEWMGRDENEYVDGNVDTYSVREAPEARKGFPEPVFANSLTSDVMDYLFGNDDHTLTPEEDEPVQMGEIPEEEEPVQLDGYPEEEEPVQLDGYPEEEEPVQLQEGPEEDEEIQLSGGMDDEDEEVQM